MKFKICMIFILATHFLSAQTVQTFSISGDVSKTIVPIQRVYIQYKYRDIEKLDSCEVVAGRYSFQDSIGGGVLAKIYAIPVRGASPVYDNLMDSVNIINDLEKNGSSDVANAFYQRMFNMRGEYNTVFFISPDSISIESINRFVDMNLKGARYEPDFLSLQKEEDEYMSKYMKPLEDSFEYYRGKSDTLNISRLSTKFNYVWNQENIVVDLEYAKNHKSSYISLYALEKAAGYPFNPELIKPVYDSLEEGIRKSSEGQRMNNQIQASLTTAVGKPEIDFSLPDTAGKKITLSSFKGKYVLLDFWASWCGPCRAEIPDLRNNYIKFFNKNFIILSVSFDTNRNKWMNAIHEHKMTWYNVSDLRYDNVAGKSYNITGIPDNFLIDPTGKIIGRNLTGEKLSKKLEEVLILN